MDEKQFMQDLWDVLKGNTDYIALEQFRERYDEFFVEIDCAEKRIRLMDEHNEWHLGVQKVWCDATQV